MKVLYYIFKAGSFNHEPLLAYYNSKPPRIIRDLQNMLMCILHKTQAAQQIDKLFSVATSKFFYL